MPACLRACVPSCLCVRACVRAFRVCAKHLTVPLFFSPPRLFFLPSLPLSPIVTLKLILFIHVWSCRALHSLLACYRNCEWTKGFMKDLLAQHEASGSCRSNEQLCFRGMHRSNKFGTGDHSHIVSGSTRPFAVVHLTTATLHHIQSSHHITSHRISSHYTFTRYKGANLDVL